MVVYPHFYDKLYLTPGFSFVLMILLNLLKNQLYIKYSISDTSHSLQKSDQNLHSIKLSADKGNSTRRLFTKSNTFFTQEEEENKGGAETIPYNTNRNEQSMSQATESRFQSMEQAQGQQMARATIQLTKSPEMLKKMDQSQGLKLWQTSAKRRKFNKNLENASPYTFKEILNQETPQNRVINIKVIDLEMEEDEKNNEDVDFVSSQQEEGHRQLQINEFKNQLAATHQELRLSYPFQEGSEDSKSRRISMSELDVNSRGVQETEIGPSHPQLEPRQLLETETQHIPTLISPRNVQLEFDQPPEKFTTLRSPLRTDMILGNTLTRKLVFDDSNQSLNLNVEPQIQEEKYSTGLNQMNNTNNNQLNQEDPTQSFSSIHPLNRVKIMSAQKDNIRFESDISNNIAVNIVTTDQGEQQQQLLKKSISVKYWLTHALLVNCGLLVITLLLWNKRLSSERYDVIRTSEIARLFLYWIAISLSVNIAVEIILSTQIALQLRRKETPSKLLKLIVFGGDFSYKYFIEEFTVQKREIKQGSKSDTQMTKDDSSQKDLESHRRMSKLASRRSQNLQRKRLRHLIKT